MFRLVLVFLLVAMLVSAASAQAPTGFGELPWGTSPTVLREQVLAKRCKETSESRRGWLSLQCRDYVVGELTIPHLRLDFEPADALAGYYMIIARSSFAPFRDLAVQRFGRPTSRRGILWQGATLSWVSDTVTATLVEKCGPDISCMEVTTRALEQKRQQILDRERKDSQQAF